ncbi:MAG TPA: ABC transporter substrate-binding protein [Solirubrobacteraceae bacterium]|jgi:peptide/nickel transport system substrate-binding protein|nr:ABC transporter substrate-binding protein [Solirubrobacteraceae bacterium]
MNHESSKMVITARSQGAVSHDPRPARRMRGSVRAGLAATMAIAAVAVAACGGSSSSGGGSSAGASGSQVAATDSTPTQGGTIYYAHEQETPCLTGGWVQEAFIERQYADSLVSQETGGKIVPWLATSWSISSNRLVYTFHLKPGVKFTDGTPLNAQAVVDNFDTWTNPKTANGDVNAFIVPYFKSAQALSDLTVQVTLNKPYAPLLSTLSQGYDGILSPKGLARGAAATCDDPIGSGPFIIQKWNHGQDIEFVRNPNYDSAPANALHQGPAYVNKLVWSFVANPTTRYGSLTSGQSNVIYDVPTADWDAAKEQYNVAQYITPGRPQTLDLNTTHGVFTDQQVREAFAYAANRPAAVQSAFDGEVPFNGNGALSQSTPDYDATLADAYAYDPSKANALLDQAGWSARNAAGYRTKDGKVLEVKLVYGAGSIITDEGATVLQDLQQQWKAAGFDVTLVPATLSQLFSGTYSTPTSYDATIGYWTSPTPGVLLIVWRPWDSKTAPNPNNASFYDNPEVVSLIEAANSASDPATQQADYDKAQQIVVQKAAVVGVYTQTTSLAWVKSLHDVWIEASQGEPVFSDAYFSK